MRSAGNVFCYIIVEIFLKVNRQRPAMAGKPEAGTSLRIERSRYTSYGGVRVRQANDAQKRFTLNIDCLLLGSPLSSA